MGSGGARIKSGPPPVEGSARSEQRGFKLTELPAKGYAGPVPDWPLGVPTDGEAEVWEWAWSTPQACAWSLPTEQWRIPTVALWVRTKVRCDAPDAPASLMAVLFRLADQVGMTTAGLSSMGWKIAAEPSAAKKSPSPAGQPAGGRERRLRAV